MSAALPPGRVYLVGAGPGALGLVTLRARQLIKHADVVIYDYLCNPGLLRWTREGTEIIYAGKSASEHTLTQDEINALLIEKARAGRQTVRLKGGDPYVFGRGGEEAQALACAGIPFEVVPGISSAIAAPAYAGIPVTHRDFASAVTFVTGHEDPSKPDSAIDWAHLARMRGTKVFLMGIERLRVIAERLLGEGADSATPAALVRWGTTARQESLEGTLATMAGLAEKHGFKAPAIMIVGDVVKLRRELNWYEALPLFGQRIVVTRTRRQSSMLTERLARLGADVLEIPVIRIVPVPLEEKTRTKLAVFSSHFDWLVFTSPNAVDIFFGEFFRATSDLRDLGPVKIAAVGPATARKLEDLHLRTDLQPGIFTAEKLAAAFSEKALRSQRFCLPQGRRADPLLANHLRAAGAMVEEWILYDTQPESEDPAGARNRYLAEGAHWIAFTSASTAEYWQALKLEPLTGSPRPKAASIGPVTSAALRRLGWEIAAEASISSVDSLVDAICQYRVDLSYANK
ncbi:MAG TPA: uroporphyrinogen-III C-methyltransferase [Candidatus Methylacidiphilales bacterium]|nr:uroporphyrinogen-III C-methyltransferase [Candidatus Methylacidiphilales bacterium]